MTVDVFRIPDNDAAKDAPAVQLREIFVRGGAIAENLDDIEKALVEQSAGLFQRNGGLVRPARTAIAVRDGETVEDLGLIEVRATGLVEHVTRAATLLKWDARAKRPVAINCPRDLAEGYLARAGQWHLRPLTGVTNAPTLRPDGSLLDQPGYDRATGLLYVPQPGVVFPPIPAEPSLEDAWEAISILDELIGEFPFTSPEARSVALAALLTGVIRRSLPTSPGFGFTAPAAGTGKGLVCNTIGLVASGRKPSPITQASEEETEKRLSGLLMRGDPVISIDNITEPLGGNKLLSVLTEELAGLRPLGGSQMVNHLTNALFLFNGNNLTLLGDMCRRVLMCGMDPVSEHPERRKFGFSPVDRVRSDRGRYVGACLTILRTYLAAGSPPLASPLGSYVEWSRLVRDALIWTGEKDPCLTIDSTKASDPITERVGAVFHHWAHVIGEGQRVTVKDVVAVAHRAAANGHAGLIDALHAVAAPMARGSAYERVDPRRLGEWIKRHKDRIVGGRRIVLATELRDGNRQWYLETMQGQPMTIAPLRRRFPIEWP